MQIEYLFFAIYILLIFWMIPKFSIIKNTDLTRSEIWVLFTIKLLSGILCAIYFEKTFLAGDYISINESGKIEYELLLSNPKLFFTDFSIDIYTYGIAGVFESSNSFWANLRFSLLFKFVAVLNLITKGNFYFNSILFSSLVFFGHIAFYRIYSSIYKGHKLKLILVCFFLPSMVLYTSCVHKDGIIFLSIGLISFVLYSFLTNSRSIKIKHVLFFLLGLISIFLFRNYVLVALLPALFTIFLCKLFPLKKRIVFLLSYSFYTVVFFLSGYFNNSLNLPAAVVKRKADFNLLGEANTSIPMNELYPTFKSFMLNLPQAINHTLFRPYLWEFTSPGVLLTAFELFFYLLLIIAFLFWGNKKGVFINNFNLFGFAFFISMMLIIGYTIPNVGAIVRYRSIFWIFLLCPLVCNTDWGKLNLFTKKT